MNREEVRDLSNGIEVDGLDYVLVHGSSPGEFSDLKLAKLWRAYLANRTKLVDYLIEQEVLDENEDPINHEDEEDDNES